MLVYSTTGIPTVDPFFWDQGTMVDIGTLGGTFGFPNWINSSGQVIGISNVAGDQTAHPFFWDRGVLTDIGTFGGSYGEALRMNDAGQVIGRADFPGNFIHHAFVWKNGVMTDVGVVPGDLCTNGRGINSAGLAVGTSTNCMGVVQHLFLWENGVIHDLSALILPGSDINVVEMWDINDGAEIAAVGILPNGDQHAVLLVPARPDEIAASALTVSKPLTAAQLRNTEADAPVSSRNRALNLFRMRPEP